MLRLKELRAKFNMTQKDLAGYLDMSQQAIAKWEKGTAEPTLKNLRELAVIFGTSVDDLLDNSRVVKTSHLCVYGPKKKEALELDGFWGNLGIKVKGQEKSRWYPITRNTYERIYTELQNEKKWIYAETLNNKSLLINKTSIKKFSLVDDACDAVPNDWNLQWDAYEGNPDEFYKCLYEYQCGITADIPEKLLKGIEETIRNEKLTDEDISKSVSYITVIDSEGNEDNLLPLEWFEIQQLYTWWEELEDKDNSSIIIISEEGDFFYNSAELAIIEAPLNQLNSEDDDF